MDIESKIVRYNDLLSNDSLCVVGNYAAQQNYNAFKVFYNFLNKNKPKRILEIGTGQGGLINFINDCKIHLQLDTKIITCDINELPWYSIFVENGIDVRVENIFNNEYSEVNSDIIEFIQQDGLSLVLCDGGNKIKEFNLLSKFLKTNDIIMAHDYAPNREYFEKYMKYKIWNWMEIQDSDINYCCTRENLVPYCAEEFLSVAWVCKLKS